MATEPTGDRRTVATDALATLGMIIDNTQKRDAIHLAVEPVMAGEGMAPGEHVTVRDGVAFRTPRGEGLGVVDPFLNLLFVEKGQRFWFVMYPRMVHSLRHVWTHPAFPDEVGTPAPVPTVAQTQREASEAWLRDYAADANPYLTVGGYSNPTNDPDLAYKTLMNDIKHGTLIYRGRDMHSFGDLDRPAELKYHASIVLGREVKWEEFEYFSCSC